MCNQSAQKIDKYMQQIKPDKISIILGSFGLVTFLFIALMTSALYAMTLFEHIPNEIYMRAFMVSNAAHQLEIYIGTIQKNMLLSITGRVLPEQVEKEIESLDTLLLNDMRIIDRNFAGDRNETELIVQLIYQWRQTREDVFNLIGEGKLKEAEILFNSTVIGYSKKIFDRIHSVRKFSLSKAKLLVDDFNEKLGFERSVLVGVTALVVLAMVFASYLTWRSILQIRQLSRTQKEVRRLNAELEQRIVSQDHSRKLLKKQNVELDIAAKKLREEEALLLEQHKQALDDRERMIEMEKLSSVGTMVGGVAHEINNPLMGVMNFVEFAMDKATDRQSIAVLGDALYEINRIKKIVQNMLVFIRDEKVAHESCDVQKAIRQTVALLGGELKANAVHVIVDVPEYLPHIKCGSGSLQQVLVNLMLNSRDAMEGMMRKNISIIGSCQDDIVTLLVCDNGPGVPDAIRQKIFDPFFTTKPVGKGTGLGLSVTRHIVDEVGGSLDYTNKEGYGCCFQIEFHADNLL